MSAILLQQQQFDGWSTITLGAATLANARPGQFVALRCTAATSYDPLIRQPLFIATTEPGAGTCTLLVAHTDPAFDFLARQPHGATLDLLGPLGHGWELDGAARMLALLGTAADAPALWSLAHWAIERELSVSVLWGADDQLRAPAPSLLPAAAEYNVATGADAGALALTLLDDAVVRWADQIALALPEPQLTTAAQRIRNVRLQWPRGFAQAALLERRRLACSVGACGVCAIDVRQGTRLACVDGPVFDLRDLVR